MMLQLNDDGVFEKVDEEKLITVNIDELNEFINKTARLEQENNELQKENRQLKQQFNYIQNSISEHIKHQKTKLGQKALQEIIEDYNEWLLGHKRL